MAELDGLGILLFAEADISQNNENALLVAVVLFHEVLSGFLLVYLCFDMRVSFDEIVQ